MNEEKKPNIWPTCENDVPYCSPQCSQCSRTGHCELSGEDEHVCLPAVRRKAEELAFLEAWHKKCTEDPCQCVVDAEAKGRSEATQPIKCPTCGKNCLEALNGKCHDCWAKFWYAKGRREALEAAADHILKAFRGAEAKTDFPSFADALASSVRSLPSPASDEKCKEHDK